MNSTMTIYPTTTDRYVVNPSTGTSHWVTPPPPQPALTTSNQPVECPDHATWYSVALVQSDGKSVHFCPDCLVARLKLLIPSYEVR